VFTSQPVRWAGITQLVEYQLPKLKVAGSSPVARSIETPRMRNARYIRIAGPLAALALGGGLACSPAHTADPRSDLDRAVAVFVAGDYETAVRKLSAVSSSTTDEAVRREAYLYIGRSEMALGDTDAAMTAFSHGVEHGDTGPCVDYIEVLKQYQEGSPQGLHIIDAISRAQLAGAVVRMFDPGASDAKVFDPRGPTPIARAEQRGWLPALPDGNDHAEDPVTAAALYMLVANVLADLGMPGRADDVFPGGYAAAAQKMEPVSGREALAALERVRTLQETHGR
jgi:hypothetical protein